MTTIIIFLYWLIPIYINGENHETSLVKLLNFKGDKPVIIYSQANKDSIIKMIADNPHTEEYYEFYVLEKKDSMIKVKAITTLNKDETIGWIKITDTGIYSRTYSENSYPLYETPRYDSKIIVTIKDKFGTLVQVTDIKDGWLKVKVKCNNIIYEYWLPKKYQCHTAYNSCT